MSAFQWVRAGDSNRAMGLSTEVNLSIPPQLRNKWPLRRVWRAWYTGRTSSRSRRADLRGRPWEWDLGVRGPERRRRRRAATEAVPDLDAAVGHPARAAEPALLQVEGRAGPARQGAQPPPDTASPAPAPLGPQLLPHPLRPRIPGLFSFPGVFFDGGGDRRGRDGQRVGRRQAIPSVRRMNSAWSVSLEAISPSLRSPAGAPVRSVTTPPASRTSSRPAAWSHGSRLWWK